MLSIFLLPLNSETAKIYIVAQSFSCTSFCPSFYLYAVLLKCMTFSSEQKSSEEHVFPLPSYQSISLLIEI